MSQIRLQILGSGFLNLFGRANTFSLLTVQKLLAFYGICKEGSIRGPCFPHTVNYATSTKTLVLKGTSPRRLPQGISETTQLVRGAGRVRSSYFYRPQLTALGPPPVSVLQAS